MTHRHPQAPPGHFEVHIVLNPTADRAAAHHSHVSKKIDCMLQLEFGLIDEEYMFFFTLVCISLLRTPTFRRFRGRKTHTFWHQQTVHPDLVLRCCVHAPDANTFAVS